MAQQTIDIGAAPNDGTGDPIRDAFDKCNDNFTELYTGLTGLLDFKGSTDCSANPNYPAASKGDFYVVSVAGKIGGASGADVEVGDAYFAKADNAGGTQAAVGTDWSVIQGNTTGAGSGIDVEDEGGAVATATVLNFTGAGVVATDAGGGQVDVTIAGGGGGIDVEDEGVAEATGATILNFTGAGVTATDVGGGQVDVDIPGGSGSVVLITETVTSGSAANVQFASIPNTYRDLMVRIRGRGTKAATLVDIRLRFNGDTGANYDSETQQANNTGGTNFAGAGATSCYIGNLAAASATANVADFIEFVVADYRGTTFQKAGHALATLKTGTAGTNLYNEMGSLWWRSTSAITQIDIFPGANAFVDGTVVSLYGIM